ncbi:TetR/AcrR family transcriptional regulator [Antrihabitans cavernicola]|uniref:TetR/AcrR family transcriptional regulator n=1 Tax=Antrihabitans cavernicola TaxID=2495913 RepID=A0A5A7SGC5_9NOCA|nr:TetR/AcrR family transcriptional regulator [Spelaeibacter cavernicola]KAA0023727.1 TetR/AcrR family transcriptional regulator [Spelaeibacter cavernicola]
MTDDAIPPELRRLWGIGADSRLGRPAELDVTRVVTAAVDLADRDGLAGVTLPKVAKELGFTAMSLYRHVGSKDELLSLMREYAMGPAPTIDVSPSDRLSWRRGLTQWATAERLVYHRRPWLPRLPVSGPPSGPNLIAWMEIGLAILRPTGLGWHEKVGVMTLTSGYVRQMAVLFDDLAQGRAGTGLNQSEAEQRYGRSLAALVSASTFPETSELFASNTFDASGDPTRNDPIAGHDFVFGLNTILDGVEAAIGRLGNE